MHPDIRLTALEKSKSVQSNVKPAEELIAQLTEQLQSSEQRAIAGRLALEVMHEIRNPLDSLANLTHLAMQEADNPRKVRDYLLQAEEQMANLAQIAKQTLGFAQQPEKPGPANLVHLAEAALRIHQRTIEQKRIHLVKDLGKDLMAEIHGGEILQVVSNLIVNALDALPSTGTIHLRLRKRGAKVNLIVADNGVGIDPGYTGVIFQPFFTTKDDRGTGLGLALTRRIIERHQGKIQVRSSTRAGRSGTTFKVTLPLR